MMDTTNMPRTEHDLEALFVDLFDALTMAHPDDFPGEVAEMAEAMHDAYVTTFANGGYMTRDAGVVIRLANGAEFQITLKQSSTPDGGYTDEDEEDEDDDA